MMDEKNVMNLPWKAVGREWFYLLKDSKSINEVTIEEFVEQIFKVVSDGLNIPYKTFVILLKQKNTDFYEKKAEAYKGRISLKKESKPFLDLIKELKIPDFTAMDISVQFNDKLNICKRLFECMSDEEKILFLCSIGEYKFEKVEK